MSHNKRKTQKIDRLLPVRVARILGDPPTTAFEEDDDFGAIHAEMILEYKPKDVQEHFLVRDIADAQWRTMKLNEMISTAIEVKIPKAALDMLGLEYMIVKGCNWQSTLENLTRTVRRAVYGEKPERDFVEKLGDRAGVSLRMLKTEAFALALPTVSTIMDLVAKAEKMRNQAIKRLLERRLVKSASRSLVNRAGDVIDVDASDDATPTGNVKAKDGSDDDGGS